MVVVNITAKVKVAGLLVFTLSSRRQTTKTGLLLMKKSFWLGRHPIPFCLRPPQTTTTIIIITCEKKNVRVRPHTILPSEKAHEVFFGSAQLLENPASVQHRPRHAQCKRRTAFYKNVTKHKRPMTYYYTGPRRVDFFFQWILEYQQTSQSNIHQMNE